jgi:hypothetical protein
MPKAFAMSGWHYQLLHNVIFVVELLLVVVYSLARRRARADRVKYNADVDSFFKKADRWFRGDKRPPEE